MLLWLLACGKAELTFDPASLDLGTVDFAGEMPDDGYTTAGVAVTNSGSATAELSLPAYDTDRLCLKGFDADADYPVDLGPIDPGSTYQLTVGVCFYVSGEIDTLVETELEVDADAEAAVLPISFTPTRTASDAR